MISSVAITDLPEPDIPEIRELLYHCDPVDDNSICILQLVDSECRPVQRPDILADFSGLNLFHMRTSNIKRTTAGKAIVPIHRYLTMDFYGSISDTLP